MRSCSFVLAVGLAGSGCLTASGADWPQWRGPERNGISQETGLLKEWPKGGPRLLWHLSDIGYGYSTPSVVGERIYLLSNTGMDNEFVQALDVQDGKKIWETRIGKVGPNNYPAARSTPTVEGEVLYALGSNGDLACLDTANGKVRWTKNLRREFGGKPGFWAYAESPLIDGDVLICTPGGTDATMIALNKQTGNPIWKSAVPGGDYSAYASGIVVNFAGVKQYVQLLRSGLIGVDARTGKFLWRYDKTAKGSMANIATPVAHDDMIYCAGGSNGGLVKLKAESGRVTAEPVYFSSKLPTAIGGSIEMGGYLYGTKGPTLACTEFATGKEKWSDRSVGTGALCYADGCLYLHSESGSVALVDASPDAYREKGRFKLTDLPQRKFGSMEKAWSYPVIANGRLYIRDLNMLWCYDVRDSKAAN
jgi:outer membrane protein assembly factor BamB